MCNEAVIRRFAGIFVLASVVLAWWQAPLWCAFTAFVGFNLVQSSFTSFCPLERALGRFGFPGCTPRGSRA